MRAVRISKRNVNPRIFLILQNLPNHFLEIDVRPNGKFAHAVTVFVGVRVLPEVVFQFAIVGMRLREPVSLDVNRQRILPQVSELRAQVIPDHTIDHERAIHFARSRENFSARQVPPLFRSDNPAGLQPLVIVI